jgi:hypothetical protein
MLSSSQIFLQIRVGVRVTMSEVNSIVIALELMVKLQRVVLLCRVAVHTARLILKLVLEILDVLACPMPTEILFLLRVDRV